MFYHLTLYLGHTEYGYKSDYFKFYTFVEKL